MLRPFSRFCVMIGAIPESIIHSLSYEQQLLRLIKFLKTTVIPAIDGNTIAIQKIEEWIENVDLQEFVDNKLDEMAESGELEEIIAQYINANSVLAYDTVTDMKNANNLINGSVCKVLGNTSLNDGYNHTYKIRTITSSDVVDEDNIISLNFSNTLIAEKIKDKRKVIIIGDSYTNHNFEDITKHWYEYFKDNLGLTFYDTLFVKGQDGGGFANDGFMNCITYYENIITDKQTITDIFVVGGWNDRSYDVSTTKNKMSLFNTYVRTNYPNATITVAFVGNSSPSIRQSTENRIGVVTAKNAYYDKGSELNWKVIKNAPYILHNYKSTYWEADGVHPSQLGQDLLGTYLTMGFVSGVVDIHYADITEYSTLTNSGVVGGLSGGNCFTGIDNEYSYLISKDLITLSSFNTALNFNGTGVYEIATLNGNYLNGNSNAETSCVVPIIVQYSDKKLVGTAKISIEYGKVKLVTPLLVDNNSWATNVTPTYIYIDGIDIKVPSQFA